jgi:hypothetical protein
MIQETETDRFEAIGANGRRYVVIERSKFLVSDTLSHGRKRVKAGKVYVLADGRGVVWKDDTRLQIDDTDEIIQKV